MRPALLRLLAGLLLLSWTAALAHVAHEGCAATTMGRAVTADGDAEEGHCAHGAVGDFAEGKFSSAIGSKALLAAPTAVAVALLFLLPTTPADAGTTGWERDLLDPGGGAAGWFMGGRPAHPVRGPSIRA